MGVTKGQGFRYPDPGDAPNVPLSVQRLAEDADLRSVQIFTTVADRSSKLAGVVLVEGMLSYVQSLNRYQRWTSTAWEDAFYVGPRFVSAARSLGSVTDTYSPGGFRPLVAGTWPSAPAGDYALDVTLLLIGSAVTSGNIRASAGGVNVSADHRLDLTNAVTPYHLRYPFVHGGGNLPFSVDHQIGQGVGTIVNAGSKVTVEYLGRRVA